MLSMGRLVDGERTGKGRRSRGAVKDKAILQSHTAGEILGRHELDLNLALGMTVTVGFQVQQLAQSLEGQQVGQSSAPADTTELVSGGHPGCAEWQRGVGGR